MGSASDKRWQECVQRLQEFQKEHGHVKVPYDFKCRDGYALGQKVSVIRRGEYVGNYPERIQLLEKMGFVFDAQEARWQEFLDRLCAFGQERGHLRVAQDYVVDGYALGQRVHNVRTQNYFVKDYPERIKLLQEIGFIFDALEAAWEEFLDHLYEFYQEHRHLQIPQVLECADGYKLGQRVHDVRHKNIFVKDHPERRKHLQDIGFIFDPHVAKWKECLRHLAEYGQENGHLQVVQKYKCADGYALGQRVVGIRTKFLFVKNHPERIGILNEMGFDWKKK